MNLAPFEGLLKQAIGLDAASIGASAVESAVWARASACCAGDNDAYLAHLRTSPGELAELIDAVVVPETWFFRDRGAFAALTRIARDEWTGKRPRLLSFPCATGEEPYSIAMTLTEAGLAHDRFSIDALDVSRRLIGRAAAGIYGKNSFRGADLAFRDCYFTREGDSFRLAEPVRSSIDFREGNLLHPDSIGRVTPYDAVFCRNLLIYFDGPTQERALRILAGLVRDGGILFVGPSEANLLAGHGFEPVKAPMAFAFRKGVAAATGPSVIAAGTVRPLRRPTVGLPPHPFAGGGDARVGAASAPPDASPAGEPRPASDGNASLGAIQGLADAGHLAEAARRCEAHLSEVGPSPDALVLLALIRDAAGNATEAIELYRKALYLDPDHEAALSHLMLRLEGEGDEAGAKRLNQRMRRVAERRAR